MRMLPTIAATLLAALPLHAQDQQKEAIEEFRSLALKKVQGFEEMKARGEAMGEWRRKFQDVDLGKHEFAKAIAAYFARDYETAGKELTAYYEKQKGFPSKDFDTISGRIFMSHAIRAFRNDDFENGGKWIGMAVDFYQPVATIYAAAGRTLASKEDDGARRVLIALTKRALADDRMTATDKIATLRRMYAPPRARSGGTARSRGPKTIKPFTATDMDGEKFSLAGYKGQVVLVDFWATWCGPCLREMPNVVKAYEKYNAAGFEVIGISLDKDGAADKIRETAKKLGMTWRQVYEGGGWGTRLAKANGIRSIPATFLFDRSGKCRATNLRGAALAREVAKLLKERVGGR